MKLYNNYHKHDHISNIFTPDTNTKQEEYIRKAVEYGHKNYFTTNHGSMGDIFEARTLCDKYEIRCLAGLEGYIVPDPLEKDKSNYHIIIIPRTDAARKKVNYVSSHANIDGYYYKPRIFIQDLLDLAPDDVYITTACCAGLLRDGISIEKIFMPLYEHFGTNILLEVQNHNVDSQIEINKKAIALSSELGLKLIAANDSHYIDSAGQKERLELLKGKHIVYGEEDEFVLDYPDYDTMFKRFQKQGVLTDDQIRQAIDNTLIFDECEEILLDKSIKMPTIYPELTLNERMELLEKEVWERFEDIKIEDEITKEELPRYIDGINYELDTVRNTNEICHTADYLLLNEKLINIAVNKFGGVLTRGGRGSAGSFYINRLLGITQLDRFRINLPIYPDRFASTARLNQGRNLMDCDMNTSDQKPFIKASRVLLGEHGCYPMVAYGTMQLAEAFRNVCRSKGLEYEEFNEIGKNIEQYTNNSKWKPIVEEAEKYVGTVVSASVHPCAHALDNKDLRYEYGVVRMGDFLCVMITSGEADEYKILKNDYLLVTVWKLISETFEAICQPILPARKLLEAIKDDERIWDLFKKGLTCTLNQVDSDNGMQQAKKYGIHSFEDGALIAAAIRPSFDSWRGKFLNHEEYTTGSKDLDVVLDSGGGTRFILFQESLMQYFEWLGVTPAESIGLIKKISKKKIHPEDFQALEDRLRTNWIVKTGSEDNFDETWQMIQSCMSYGFCLSGNTKICYRESGNSELTYSTIQELYRNWGKKKNLKTISMIEEDSTTFFNDIVDIYFTGIQQTYTIITRGGREVKCTWGHKFPTPRGERKLQELNVGDELYVVSNGIITDEIVSIKKADYESVYCIEMADYYHNYMLANGIITSNCSAHAAAVSLDMCYGAYLKVNYPLEYYTVCFNNYVGDEERTRKLTNELPYFGVKLQGVKFGHSRAKYSFDKETNTIYKGLESIKFINDVAPEELYELSSNSYQSFTDLLFDIKEKTTLNSRQLDILIKIDFFSEFGDINKLLYLAEKFALLYGAKTISKQKIPSIGLTEDEIRPFAGKETETRVDDIDVEAFKTKNGLSEDNFEDCYKYSYKTDDSGNKVKIKNGYSAKKIFKKFELSEEEKLKYATKIVYGRFEEINIKGLLNHIEETAVYVPCSVSDEVKYQQEYLGYIDYVDPGLSNRYVVVTNLNTSYSPKFDGYCLATGQTMPLKVHQKIDGRNKRIKTWFTKTSFVDGDILYMKSCEKKQKMKKIDGEWQNVEGEYDWWINDYEIAKL